MASNKGRNAQPMKQIEDDADDMMSGGKDRVMLEFWPGESAEAGATMIGKVTGFREINTQHGSVTIAEFSPVVTRNAGDDQLYLSSGVALMLSAALRLRINSGSDTGRVFAIAYDGLVKQGKGQMREYRVVEQSEGTLRKLAARAINVDGGDDLPF
jgi:hypothetical protein